MKNLTKKELLEMKEAYDNAKGMKKEYDFSKGKRGAVASDSHQSEGMRQVARILDDMQMTRIMLIQTGGTRNMRFAQLLEVAKNSISEKFAQMTRAMED